MTVAALPILHPERGVVVRPTLGLVQYMVAEVDAGLKQTGAVIGTDTVRHMLFPIKAGTFVKNVLVHVGEVWDEMTAGVFSVGDCDKESYDNAVDDSWIIDLATADTVAVGTYRANNMTLSEGAPNTMASASANGILGGKLYTKDSYLYLAYKTDSAASVPTTGKALIAVEFVPLFLSGYTTGA